MPKGPDETKKQMARLLPVFHAAVTEGVRDYYHEYQTTARVHRAGTRCNIIRDHVIDRLRDALISDPDVRFRDENQTTYLGVFAEFNILVKKADDAGKVEFAKTQASLDFRRNEGQGGFESIPDVTNLCLSHVPNPEDPMNPSIVMICPGENGPIWAFEIEPHSGAGGATIIEITPPPPPPPPPPSGSDDDLVRIPNGGKTESDDPHSV
jgi:hypothetical protein